jgi:hypothetical protein
MDSRLPFSQEAAVGYNPQMPTESEAEQAAPVRAQRLGWDVNNPTAPDMQQWRPAYRQPPLGDVDHGDSIGANDEDQDNTRFARGFPRPSLQQEVLRMRARENFGVSFTRPALATRLKMPLHVLQTSQSFSSNIHHSSPCAHCCRPL